MTTNSSCVCSVSVSPSTTVRRTVSVEVRPSRMATTRSTRKAMAGSWETITMLVPYSLFRRRKMP